LAAAFKKGTAFLNPRLIGEPGLGKTTLACAVARVLQTEVYIFQCTMAAKQCRDSIRDILSLAQYAQKLRNKGIDQPLPKAVEQILARPDAGASKE
jgi:MoxR-like ATPase